MPYCVKHKDDRYEVISDERAKELLDGRPLAGFVTKENMRSLNNRFFSWKNMRLCKIPDFDGSKARIIKKLRKCPTGRREQKTQLIKQLESSNTFWQLKEILVKVYNEIGYEYHCKSLQCLGFFKGMFSADDSRLARTILEGCLNKELHCKFNKSYTGCLLPRVPRADIECAMSDMTNKNYDEIYACNKVDDHDISDVFVCSEKIEGSCKGDVELIQLPARALGR
jgi:hypothetical protein